eukprot:2767724-Rhodomonas_salina.4
MELSGSDRSWAYKPRAWNEWMFQLYVDPTFAMRCPAEAVGSATGISPRACDAISGSAIVYGTVSRRACYAMSGTA